MSASVTALLLVGAWWLFVGTVSPQEWVVGALAIAAATVYESRVRAVEPLLLHLSARDVAQAWRLPGTVLSDAWIVTRLLVLDFWGAKKADSRFRLAPFYSGAAGDDPHARERQALAVAYSTVSPNSIVLGVDRERNLMLFHQVERRPLPTLTRALLGETL